MNKLTLKFYTLILKAVMLALWKMYGGSVTILDVLKLENSVNNFIDEVEKEI